MYELCTFCNRITLLWAKGNKKLVAPKPKSLQAVEFRRHIVTKEDKDGGVFGEKIKGREAKLGSAAPKKRVKRRNEVLKPPNVPE